MTTTSVARPSGPAADITSELTGGNGPFIAASVSSAQDLKNAGYVEAEYAAAGTATTYTVAGELAGDGRWTFTPGDSAPYRTRVIVRRPANPARFSGTAVVEWLNVSGGFDADPDWQALHEDLLRKGDMWVGISAQLIGVTGGPVLVSVPGADAAGAGSGLTGHDPARYGSLTHPGDGFAFDIFTQVARAIRLGGPATGNMQPARVIAAGESQSAFALVTYVDGVQPLTHAFDGFFVHSRGAVGLPIAAPGKAAGIVDAIAGTPAIFRTDTTVPVLDLQTESDVGGILNSVAARQPDSEVFRLWEVAGTAHADRRLIGPLADMLDCGAPVNNAPTHVVAKAAFRALDTWVRTGTPPPSVPRFETTTDSHPALVRDSDGIVKGGVRTPPVDVPVDVLSGTPGPKSSPICLLVGSTIPLPASRLAQRYSSRADYERKFAAAADEAIAAGVVLADDRAALMAYADPSRLPA